MKKVLYSLAVTIIYNSLLILPLVKAVADKNLRLLSGKVIAPVIKNTPALFSITPNKPSIIRATITSNVGVNNVTVSSHDDYARIDFNPIERRPDFATGDHLLCLT